MNCIAPITIDGHGRASWAGLIDGKWVRLTGMQHALFMALWNDRGRGLTSEQIFQAIYGDREDGGPLRQDTILVHAYQLRRALEPTRFRIPLRPRGTTSTSTNGRWRLIRLPEGA